ncbi:hypothetical protein QQ045_002477 [Rhodiola kirilowii]
MADFGDELDEIEALISSGIKSSKAVAYPTLLNLQERCGAAGDDESSIGMLARRSQSLLNLMIEDVFDDDEEIAAQACKCLGFMIYHPSIVATISVDVAGLIMQSLAKLIIITKIKSVCNLGVWCISIQQFKASFLYAHFDSLMMAVTHALDNPAGSLSTTFEAVQAILKLESQLNERLKETSNLWAPPIYRRLISVLKKDRDVSERCLLKLKSIINPPTSTLAEVVVFDMKKKLLPGLKELQSQGLIIQAVNAWGWFISLIGPHATQHKHLLNEMLSFIEQTFTDHRPQVQIASLVAWERLIDALINPQPKACDSCVFIDSVGQECTTSLGKHGTHANKFFKSIKLIMTPLIGIMSSKCDTPVQSACMKAWCYLLHKLGQYVNCLAVSNATLEPILKAVFRMRPSNRSNWLLNLCIEILNDSVSAKYILGDQTSSEPVKSSMSSVTAECLWKQYPLKWLPWGINQLEFYMDMVQVLGNQGVLTNGTLEYRSLMIKSTIRIYRSILKGIQVETESLALNYDPVMLCLSMTLQLITKFAEDATSGENTIEKLELSIRLIEATTEELDLSILGSPQYKVTLDFNCIKALSANKFGGGEALNMYLDRLKDMSSHVVYLTAIYFSVFTKILLISAEQELILQKFHNYLKPILSSDSSLGAFRVILSLMYCNTNTWGFKTWMAVAAVMKDIIGGSGDVSRLKLEHDSNGYLLACYFLTYPLYICSSPLVEVSNGNYKGGRNTSPASVSKDTDMVQVIEEWRSIFYLVNDASKAKPGASKCFIENLCTTVNKHLQNFFVGNNDFGSINSCQKDDLPSMLGNVVICVLDQVMLDAISIDDIPVGRGSISLRNTLTLVVSCIQVACSVKGAGHSTHHGVTARVLSALTCFISCLHQRQQVILLFEAIHDCLLHCLSHIETWNGISDQLQLLWTEILNSLQSARPPFVFNSSLLKSHAALLEKTLDHPNRSISETTIKFWNSTYGKQLLVDYPPCLMFVLDKLCRDVKISIFKRSAEVLQKCNAVKQLQSGASTSGNCMITKMNNRSSKRVELVEQDPGKSTGTGSNLKRARLELTEHQKEVRRAQQGKERDCNGHGPGVRTYTTLDFSQTNDDSQELEDIRNTESILEMLKRPH